MTLISANAPVPGPTLRMLDELSDHQPLTTVLVDRGFSMATHANWAGPILERGLDQVVDLADNQRGPVLDPSTGVLMIDGWPCARWTPRHLHKIARPPRFALKKPGPKASSKQRAEYSRSLTALLEFQAAQAELAQYALAPNGRRKANGTRHFFAPVYGRHTATAAQRRTKASLKTLDGEGVQRGWIRVVGIAAVGLMATFAIVHYNLRMLRKRARTTGYAGDDIILSPAPEVLGYEPVEFLANEAAIEPPEAA